MRLWKKCVIYGLVKNLKLKKIASSKKVRTVILFAFLDNINKFF